MAAVQPGRRQLLTFSTKVFSLSGISKGVVVRTSAIDEQTMLTRGLAAWEKTNPKLQQRAMHLRPPGTVKTDRKMRS